VFHSPRPTPPALRFPSPERRWIARSRAVTPSGVLANWPDYLIDALQRSVLFLDLLRQRGNEEIEITSRPWPPCSASITKC